MPGSEGGDRVHNFFDQEKFIYKNSQPQVVDGSRLVSSGFHWTGDQRRESSSLNFSPGHTASDPDRGNLDRQSSLVHSSPFLQSPQGPTFIASPNLMQHTSLNGYIQDNHLVQAKHDETDFMGMNRESNQKNPFSRELLNSGAQFRNVSEQYRDARQETTEAPVNFDFLGGPQQLNSRQLGMLQSSPRQHTGLNERQLLQQQAMLRNLYDVQRQQQLQKQDTRQMNAVNNLYIGHQKPNDRSPSLNRTSFQDGSNYAWMSLHGAGNPNWLHGAVSPVMHGTTNGILISTEESVPPHSFGFSPQSVDHSLYGFPISNAGGPSNHSSRSMEKAITSSKQVPTESIPVPDNQYGSLLDQVSGQEREFGFRFGFQKNNNLTNASSQVSYPGTVMGNSSQAESRRRIPSMEFLGIQGVSSSSMNSMENTLSKTVILQDAAPLDPTEEQFLFGSDDNVWDAFGKSSQFKLVDNKTVEGLDIQNQFPSMQSGSWSALMQSALAETSSGDTGNQEKWSGLNLIGKPDGVDHESLAFTASEKQRTSLTFGNLHTEPSLDVNHCMSLVNAGNTNSHSMQGLPLSSLSGSSDVNEKFQFNSASKPSRQVFEGNSLKAHPGDNRFHSKSDHHPAAALNLKGPSGAWDPQHGASLKTIGNQVYNNSSHDTYMGPVPSDGSRVRSTSNENTMSPRHDEQKRFMRVEIQNDNSTLARNSFPKSPSPIGQVNSNSCVATGPAINYLQDNLNSSQKPPVSYHYNHWKHVGSIPEVGSENRARGQHPPGEHPHVLDSLFDTSDKKNQQQSSFMDTASGNKFKDTFISGQSNQNVADWKQKASGQVAGCSPAIRNYLNHSAGQGPKSFTQTDKGKGSNFNTGMRKLQETSLEGHSMHHLANKTFQSSQSMVECFNKPGRSRGNSAEASRNSSGQNMFSEKPAAESPGTSVSHLQQNHFLGSQTYGLQLGLLHQEFPTQSRGSSPAPSSLGLNSGQIFLHHPSAVSQAELYDVRSGFLGQSGDSVSLHKVQEHSSASITSGPPDWETPSSSSQADKNIQSNVRSRHVGFPSAWNSVPNQQGSFQPDRFTSQSHMKPFVVPFKKDELNTTLNGNDSPRSGAHNTIFTSESSGEDQRATDSSWKTGMPDKTGLELRSANAPGKDTVTHANHENSGNSVKSDVKPQNSYLLLHQLQDMRNTEIDPNNRDSKRLKVQSSSADSQQSPPRFGQHQSVYSPTVTEIGNFNLALSGDPKLGKITSVPSINQGRYFPLQHGSVPFQNTPNFGQNDSQNIHNGRPAVSNKLLTHISAQMAPTWIERCGSLNREYLVPASDAWKHSLSRPLEPGQTLENSPANFLAQNCVQQVPSPSVSNQVGDMKHCSAPEHIVLEQSTSPQLTALTSPSLVSVVPHKLETATSTATLELLPWYKEVVRHGLRDLPNISASEVKWANATKRIPEKMMDEMEQADERTVKCKRRIVLTTQLMQQLLDPPPASVMSSDAYMNYESVVYFTSRLSCGSACCLSGSKYHQFMKLDHENMIYKKVPEQGNDLLSKVENDFLARASKLEKVLSSLEKQTSIQDLRIEWQDVEKFSVINRFAKFHGRVQSDGPAILNSAINSQNHGPQRYVTALPSPRNLPDTVQCLSL